MQNINQDINQDKNHRMSQSKNKSMNLSKNHTPNLISLSVAPVNVVIGKRYYDLSASIELMKVLQQKGAVDGFEFQIWEEWDEDHPPLDQKDRRLPPWQNSQKYSIGQISALVKESGIKILSVHAKRDIGIYLCSNSLNDTKKGEQLTDETLSFADEIGAGVCVFHIWDTWSENIDIEFLNETLHKISLKYPSIKASVENVPTSVKKHTPFELLKYFEWITLDLQWAALFNEFEKYEDMKDKIANVHLRGELEQSRWASRKSSFGFYEALDMIRGKWGYTGVLTMEPNGLRSGQLDQLISAMQSLKE